MKPKFFPMSAPKPSEVDANSNLSTEAIISLMCNNYATWVTTGFDSHEKAYQEYRAELLRRLSAPTEEIVPTRFEYAVGIRGHMDEPMRGASNWNNIRHVSFGMGDYADLFYAWNDNEADGCMYFGKLGSHPEREFQVVENWEGK